MAEIARQVWIKASMEAAMRLLDARSRAAIAEADVTEAEGELERLTGSSASIDLNRHSYTRHFDCEGPNELAVIEDRSQENGAKPEPIGPCRRVVEIWGDDNDKAPKICSECAKKIAARRAKVATPTPPAPPEGEL